MCGTGRSGGSGDVPASTQGVGGEDDMEPFADLTDQSKRFIIALIEELDQAKFDSKDKFEAIEQPLMGRWAFTADRQGLELSTDDGSILGELEKQEHIYNTIPGAVVRVYRILQKARNHYKLYAQPPASTGTATEQPEFSFIADPDLRSIMDRDYQEIQACLDAKAYKAAIVMCGSVMEALLLDALLQNEVSARQSTKAAKNKAGNTIKDLGRWPLSRMIDVAVELQILPTPYYGFMSDAVREHRNLIHPAVETRKQITPERTVANLARAALDVIIKNLTI
jgi:hypothetical protein